MVLNSRKPEENQKKTRRKPEENQKAGQKRKASLSIAAKAPKKGSLSAFMAFMRASSIGFLLFVVIQLPILALAAPQEMFGFLMAFLWYS